MVEISGLSEVPGALPMGWTVAWASDSLTDRRLLRSLTGHTGQIRAVATTVVDGRPVAVTGSRDKTVRVWDLASGREIREFLIHHSHRLSSLTAEVLSISSVVANGQAVAILDTDQATLALDLATGREIGEFIRVVTVGVWNGRSVALTVDHYQTLRIFDLATGRRLGELVDVQHSTLVDDRPVALVAFPPEQEEQTTRAWDLNTGCEIHEFPADLLDRLDLGVYTALIVDGRIAAFTLDTDEVVPVSDLGNGGHVTMPAPETALLDGRPVALSIDADENLHVWRPHISPEAGQRGGATHDTPGTRPPAIAVTTVAEGQPLSLAMGGEDSLSVRNLLTPNRHNDQPGSAYQHISSADAPKMTAASLVEGQQLMVAVYGHREVLVVDPATGQPVGEPLTGHIDQVWDVATATVEGRPVAVTVGADQVARVWDLAAAGRVGQPRAGHTDTILTLVTTALDGRTVVVSAGMDRTVRAWDLATGRPVGEPLTRLPDEVSVMETAEVNGRAAALTSGSDAAIQLWDLAGGQRIGQILTGSTGRVLAIDTAFVDGRPVAIAAGTAGVAEVWDVSTGRRVGQPLTGHTSRVLDIATASLNDRPICITASWDKTVRVWDLGTCRQVGEPLTGHTDWVTSVTTTALGGRPVAVTGSRDKTIRVWDLISGSQIGDHIPIPSGAARTIAATTLNDRPVIAIGDDMAVRLWDLATGHQVGAELRFPARIGALAATSCGTLVIGFGREIAVLTSRHT